MALKAYTLYAVNIDNGGGTSTDLFIDQISDWSLDPGVNNTLLAADGSVDPTFVAVMSQSPSAVFSTSALATVLAKCGISGLAIAADNVDEFGADLYLQQLAEGATRTAGSTHMRMRVSKGLLVPRAINAAQSGIATVGLELFPAWDGTRDPIVLSTSAALVGTPSVGEAFTVGPAIINGAQIAGVESLTVDPGIAVMPIGGDGSVWPTFICIQSRTPSVRVNIIDASVLSTFGIYGTVQGATDSVFYLRKKLEGSTNTADATAEHISFSVAEGMIQVGPLRGSHPGRVGAQLIITPTYNGSDAIIAISTATAITIP